MNNSNLGSMTVSTSTAVLLLVATLLLCAIVISCLRDAKAAQLKALKEKLAKLQARYEVAATFNAALPVSALHHTMELRSELASRIKQIQREIARLEKS